MNQNALVKRQCIPTSTQLIAKTVSREWWCTAREHACTPHHPTPRTVSHEELFADPVQHVKAQVSLPQRVTGQLQKFAHMRVHSSSRCGASVATATVIVPMVHALQLSWQIHMHRRPTVPVLMNEECNAW